MSSRIPHFISQELYILQRLRGQASLLALFHEGVHTGGHIPRPRQNSRASTHLASQRDASHAGKAARDAASRTLTSAQSLPHHGGRACGPATCPGREQAASPPASSRNKSGRVIGVRGPGLEHAGVHGAKPPAGGTRPPPSSLPPSARRAHRPRGGVARVSRGEVRLEAGLPPPRLTGEVRLVVGREGAGRASRRRVRFDSNRRSASPAPRPGPILLDRRRRARLRTPLAGV